MKPPTEMTDEELRVAVAERMGYKPFHIADTTDYVLLKDDEHSLNLSTWIQGKPSENAKRSGIFVIPDFPNDLNAMHEVEKTLTEEQQDKYVIKLFSALCGGDNNLILGRLYEEDIFKCATATARQRCIAFLSIK